MDYAQTMEWLAWIDQAEDGYWIGNINDMVMGELFKRDLIEYMSADTPDGYREYLRLSDFGAAIHDAHISSHMHSV